MKIIKIKKIKKESKIRIIYKKMFLCENDNVSMSKKGMFLCRKKECFYVEKR